MQNNLEFLAPSWVMGLPQNFDNFVGVGIQGESAVASVPVTPTISGASWRPAPLIRRLPAAYAKYPEIFKSWGEPLAQLDALKTNISLRQEFQDLP